MSFATLPHDMSLLTDEELMDYANQALTFTKDDRKENQILYYRPASPRALKIHMATAHLIGVGGGNRSGKTDTSLAEAVIQATGMIPDSLRDCYPREKIRGPINVRVVCESITTTLAPVILHKLNYQSWNGFGQQGGESGHWGWIPKNCLIDESWERSWKESKRELTTLCRDPDDPDRILGKSVWQFMSHDQEPKKFASGEFHCVVIDEPPSYAIYRENRTRLMSVGGRMIIGMTWPDDPTIPVDWIFDEIYDKGLPGPKKEADVEWIELVTTDNPNIDLDSVAREAAAMNETERACRIFGKPIRFSNRVHPLFTDSDSWWCFVCNQEVMAINGACSVCHSQNFVLYNHVEDFSIEPQWPTILLLDPHPRKPHMFAYVQVDANDDYSVVYAGQLDGDPMELKELTDSIQRELGLNVVKWIMDPNMGLSPASSRRNVTWRDEFASVGLQFELADDSDVGRGRVDEFLKIDTRTRRPRLRFHEGHCGLAIYQMKRFVWDDHKYKDNKDQKQVTKKKYDDYPAILRYLMNAMPMYSVLKYGGVVVRPQGSMSNGY